LWSASPGAFPQKSLVPAHRSSPYSERPSSCPMTAAPCRAPGAALDVSSGSAASRLEDTFVDSSHVRVPRAVRLIRAESLRSSWACGLTLSARQRGDLWRSLLACDRGARSAGGKGALPRSWRSRGRVIVGVDDRVNGASQAARDGGHAALICLTADARCARDSRGGVQANAYLETPLYGSLVPMGSGVVGMKRLASTVTWWREAPQT
jgi:hypothetical protein